MRPVHLLAGMQPADHIVTACCARLLEDVPSDDWVTGTPEHATCPGPAVTAVGDGGHIVIVADGVLAASTMPISTPSAAASARCSTSGSTRSTWPCTTSGRSPSSSAAYTAVSRWGNALRSAWARATLAVMWAARLVHMSLTSHSPVQRRLFFGPS